MKKNLGMVLVLVSGLALLGSGCGKGASDQAAGTTGAPLGAASHLDQLNGVELNTHERTDAEISHCHVRVTSDSKMMRISLLGEARNLLPCPEALANGGSLSFECDGSGKCTNPHDYGNRFQSVTFQLQVTGSGSVALTENTKIEGEDKTVSQELSFY